MKPIVPACGYAEIDGTLRDKAAGNGSVRGSAKRTEPSILLSAVRIGFGSPNKAVRRKRRTSAKLGKKNSWHGKWLAPGRHLYNPQKIYHLGLPEGEKAEGYE